jgi:DNA-binding NtrC family response regulator
MLRKTPATTRDHAIPLMNNRRTPALPQEFSPRRRGVLHSPVVLVVTEDSLLRWALYEALVAAHFRVLTCSDQAHAREILPKVDAQFALAIIDDDAWAMTRSERDYLHARRPHLPILVLAHPGQGLEHRVKELGVADVLLKPFDLAHLVQTVERVIEPETETEHDVAHAEVG